VHSGDASGVVPSSFRILRMLLDRIDDAATGTVRGDAFKATIPEDRRQQAKIAAAALGKAVHAKFPFVDGMAPAASELDELVLSRTWRPALSVTGLDGAPLPASAGNVLRPYTAAKLSLRLPPTVDADQANAALVRLLTEDPPYGARVTFAPDPPGTGWNAAPTEPWLMEALDEASRAAWGPQTAMMGEGGTIPFMAMLGRAFPKSQFVVTGVLGPNSNAHGPNEFLDLPTGRRVTETVAHVVAAHARR
jgi:acetylornithine deacetylase/succinyl-diaminopimelate desuccinylase-like protein